MARVELTKAKPGMRLLKAVQTLQGLTLLREGEALTEKHLVIFKSWGVRELDVEIPDGEGDGAEAPVDAAILATVEADLARRFSRAAPSVVMTEIARIARERTLRRLTRSAAREAGR